MFWRAGRPVPGAVGCAGRGRLSPLPAGGLCPISSHLPRKCWELAKGSSGAGVKESDGVLWRLCKGSVLAQTRGTWHSRPPSVQRSRRQEGAHGAEDRHHSALPCWSAREGRRQRAWLECAGTRAGIAAPGVPYQLPARAGRQTGRQQREAEFCGPISCTNHSKGSSGMAPSRLTL